MATPLSRDVLNSEVNTRFWAWTAHKIGKPLDPNIPADKAMSKVWLAILADVQKQAEAGTLVLTHDDPVVIEALADAQVASDEAVKYLRDAAATSDPAAKQQQAAAAAAAVQTAMAKAREARAGQTLNLPPEIMQEVARDANGSALPASASPADQIAHMQVQNSIATAQQNGGNGQNGQPPSQEALYQETNHRFWRQYNYKVGQKLDMSDFQDQMMAQAWLTILSDVQREAAEGRLVMTPPPFGVPQDPYAEPQPSQDLPQPQYGAYGAPPGMTPPQYGAPQGFPQAPQYEAPQQQMPQYAGVAQEIPIPQYGASQQVTPPQYGAPQDFSQYGAQQGLPSSPQTAQQPGQQLPPLSEQELYAQNMAETERILREGPPQQPQQQPQQPQMQVPPGMEGYPPDLLQYAQQQQQYAQQQQQAAPQAPQTPQTPQVPQDMRQGPAPSRGQVPTPSRGQAAPSPSASLPPSRGQAPPSRGQAAPSASAPITTRPTATTQTKEEWPWGKIGLAVLALGGLSAAVYAAKRSSHATIRSSSSYEAPPYLTRLHSRGGRY